MTESIYPCLWFNTQAREAAEYYCSIFKNARITNDNKFVVMFEIEGKKFMALNGGPQFNFNESVSFVVSCESQEEIDEYWDKLTAEGKESRCGWLKDKYGVSWQIIPAILPQLMSDSTKAARVTQAFMQMKKFNIAKLVEAAASE